MLLFRRALEGAFGGSEAGGIRKERRKKTLNIYIERSF
jgi:hypothetical protein